MADSSTQQTSLPASDSVKKTAAGVVAGAGLLTAPVSAPLLFHVSAGALITGALAAPPLLLGSLAVNFLSKGNRVGYGNDV